MNEQKKNWWLKDRKAMNKWAGVSFLGLALYVILSVMGWYLAADIVAAVFAVIAWWTFFSVVDGRSKDKETFSYNLLWGSGALAILLSAFTVLAIKQRLGL